MKEFSGMLKAKPELPYLTLSELAKAWGCSEEDILHRGIAGKVKICALSAGWELQEGYFSDDAPEGFPVPVKERWSNMEPIPLTRSSLRKILNSGEVTDPEFIFESDDEQNQGKDGEQFDRFLSSVIISNGTRSKIVARKGDLVVRKEDVLQEGASENRIEDATDSKSHPIKQKRRSEMHDLIGKIIVDLGYKNKKVQASIIWNHIVREKEKYEIIQEIDKNTIYWSSRRRIEQKMTRENFDNIISAYNTGKRPYPDN